MRGKTELPRKRPPILLFVLIFAAGFLAGTLFWHFTLSGASVPSGGTVTAGVARRNGRPRSRKAPGPAAG